MERLGRALFDSTAEKNVHPLEIFTLETNDGPDTCALLHWDVDAQLRYCDARQGHDKETTMKAVKLFATILSMILMCSIGCDDGGTKNKPIDTNQGDTTDTGQNDEVTVVQTYLNLDFENGEGAGDKFYVSIPADDDDGIDDCTVKVMEEGDTDAGEADDCVLKQYADNNTAAETDGENALMVHADAYNRWDAEGPSVEVQFTLDESGIDMSAEDVVVTFDIFVPGAMGDLQCAPQFAIFSDDGDFTPLYSVVFSVNYDQWTTLTGEVKASGGAINYSEFDDDPVDWISMGYLRVQLLCQDAAGAVNGDEIHFYLDNLKVEKVE